MYRLSFITYLIMKSLVKIKYIGLVNLVLGEHLGSKPIVKEFIQPDYNDEVQIMVELQKIDQDETYRKKICDDYDDIRKGLLPGAADNLSKLADRMIE